MTREERVLGHKKQERFKVSNGVPDKNELTEGKLELREIDNVLYIVTKKGNSIWYFKGTKTI